MIVPDRHVVRAWQRRARALVRANPVLAAQRPRRLALWNRQHSWGALRWLVPPAAFAAGFSEFTVNHLVLFGLVWTLCVTFHRATTWTLAMHSTDQLVFYFVFPVPNDTVLAHQRKLLLRASTWIGFDWAAALLGLALRDGGTLDWVLIPLVGFAAWAVTLAFALVLVWRWPTPNYHFGSTACWLLLILGMNLHVGFDWLAGAFGYGTPAGWVAFAWKQARTGAPLGWVLLVLLGAGGFVLVRLMLARFARTFSVERAFAFLDGPLVAAGAPVAAESSPPAAPVALEPLRETWAGLISRPLGELTPRTDPLERAILRLLPARDRLLADYYRPAGALRWSRGWLLALGGLGLAVLLRTAGFPFVWVSIASVGIFALPLFGGTWPGFSSAFVFQTQVGMHSLLPLGYWETARLMLLTNWLRIVAAFPLLVLGAWNGFTPEPLPAADALLMAYRSMMLVACIQPIWVIGSFSRTTNDTSSHWWVTLLALVVVPTLGFALIAAGIGLFVVQHPVAVLLCGFAPIAITLSLLGAYGFAYHRGWFDLVNRSATPQG